MKFHKCGIARHIRTVHQRGAELNPNLPGVFSCEKCPSKFTDEGDLTKHLNMYHEKKNIEICENCNRPFDAGFVRRFPDKQKACSCWRRGPQIKGQPRGNSEGFPSGRLSWVKTGKGDFVCECGNSFAKKRYLQRHQSLVEYHTFKHRISCSSCFDTHLFLILKSSKRDVAYTVLNSV